MATLEVIIAFTVLISAITGSLLVSTSSQSFLSDSANSREAIAFAEKKFSEELSVINNGIHVEQSTTTTEGIYTITIHRSNPDFFTTLIRTEVSWKDGLRSQHVSLSRLNTDSEKATGSDTCDSVLAGDWADSGIRNTTTDMATLAGNATKIYTITDIDAYKHRLYVSADTTVVGVGSDTETLFVFDIADPKNPALISKIDNDTNKPGIAGIAIASTSAGNFLYAASMSSFARGQLQIFDIGVSPPQLLKTYKIPISIVPTAGEGASIAYKNGYVYLGVSTTPGGDEFNIIDVHDPLSPVWVGGYGVTHIVNSIMLSGNYAYLAHPAENADTLPEEITIMNIADPSLPFRIGGYNAQDNQGHGKSLAQFDTQFGSYAVLGRTQTTGNAELVLLDRSNPASGVLPFVNSKEIGPSVNDMFVRSPLVFTVAGNKLQTWNVSDTANITEYAAPIQLPNGSIGKAIDCERNVLFVGSNGSDGRGYISVVSP